MVEREPAHFQCFVSPVFRFGSWRRFAPEPVASGDCEMVYPSWGVTVLLLPIVQVRGFFQQERL